MEVYLIRHTQTILGEGICCGQSDIPAKEPYLDQFDRIVNNVKFQNVRIYASPLKRCTSLVNHFLMYKEKCQTAKFDDRLKEMNFGDWEMKKWDEINQEELNKWMTDFVNEKTPGGECFTDLNQRVKEFLDEIIISHSSENQTTVIITHAGVIRSVLCQLLEIPLRNAFKIPIDYGSITKISIDKKSCYQSIGFINQTL